MTRKMTIVRAAGTNATPCLKISNQHLHKAGFALGDHVSVTYKPELIIIKKLAQENTYE